MLNTHKITQWLPQKVAQLDQESLDIIGHCGPLLETLPTPSGHPEYWSLHHNLMHNDNLTEELATTIAIIGIFHNDKELGKEIPERAKMLMELTPGPQTMYELRTELETTLSKVLEQHALLMKLLEEHNLEELLWVLNGYPYNPPMGLEPVIGTHLCFHKGQPDTISQTASGWYMQRYDNIFEISDSYFQIPKTVRIAELDTLLTRFLDNPRKRMH